MSPFDTPPIQPTDQAQALSRAIDKAWDGPFVEPRTREQIRAEGRARPRIQLEAP